MKGDSHANGEYDYRANGEDDSHANGDDGSRDNGDDDSRPILKGGSCTSGEDGSRENKKVITGKYDRVDGSRGIGVSLWLLVSELETETRHPLNDFTSVLLQSRNPSP